jgi:hypothetical protein
LSWARHISDFTALKAVAARFANIASGAWKIAHALPFGQSVPPNATNFSIKPRSFPVEKSRL